MENKIMVSINCITYNHENYIKDAIESFLMQKTTFNYEVLIHDDASTDRTADIIRSYERKYPDIIKPIIQKENQYSKGVKNISYRYNHTRALGKYIAICEGDDYWTDPYKIQKQVDYLENHPECSMCFHAAEIIKVGKGKIGIIKPYDKSCISPTEDIIIGGGGFIATNSIVYKKKAMDNPPDCYFNAPVGDYPLQILTSMKNYAYYMDEFMSAYRVGVSGSWTDREVSNTEKRIKHFEQISYMLDEINEYTNHQYEAAINRTKNQNQWGLLLEQGKLKELRTGEFREIYSNLRLKSRISIHLGHHCPNLLKFLILLKRKLLLSR